MVMRTAKAAAAMVLALAMVAGWAGGARAADPPKWVAAIYVDAQRAVGLRWTPIPGATGYKVLRSETKGAGYAEIGASPAPQYFDKGVEPGTTYYYVLQAVDAAGPSANSEEKSVAIPGQKKKALKAPEWRSLQVQETTEFGKTTFKVALTWTKVPEAVAYNVYRSETSGKDYQLVGSISEEQYIDATGAEGKTYYYALSALDNAFQETPLSAEKSAALTKAAGDKKEKVQLANPKLAMKTTKLTMTVESTPERPIGVVGDVVMTSDGEIVYADVILCKVRVYGPSGELVREFGEKGAEPGQLTFPTGIGIDADDNVYVTDRAAKARIVVFGLNGSFKREILAPPADEEYLKNFSKVVQPTLSDVAVAKDGRIFAVDANLRRILIFSPEGELLKWFGGPGSDPGKFNSPGQIAIDDARGEMHVCAGFNRRVDVFSLDGEFKRSYGLSKSFIGSFIGPTGITFDENGNSIVADATLTTLQVFSPEGVYMHHLTGETAEVEPESKQRPLWRITGPGGIFYDRERKLLAMTLPQDKKIMVRTIDP